MDSTMDSCVFNSIFLRNHYSKYFLLNLKKSIDTGIEQVLLFLHAELAGSFNLKLSLKEIWLII